MIKLFEQLKLFGIRIKPLINFTKKKNKNILKIAFKNITRTTTKNKQKKKIISCCCYFYIQNKNNN